MFQAQFFWQKKLTYQFEAGFHKVAGNTRKIEKAGWSSFSAKKNRGQLKAIIYLDLS